MSFKSTSNESPSNITHEDSRSPQPIVPNPNERAQPVAVGSIPGDDQPRSAIIEIKSAMQSFTRGEVGQPGTIARIVRALAFNGDQADVAKGKALESYIAQMHQISNVQRRESESGTSGTLSSRANGESRSRSAGGGTGNSSAPYRPYQNAGSRGVKRGRSDGEEEQERREHKSGGSGHHDDGYGEESSSEDEREGWSTDSESDSGSDRERRAGKRLREEDMPWFAKEKESRRSIDKSCVQSAELLRKYARNIAKVKGWILYSASAPAGFPSTEWDSLLKGKAVNLDVVYSSLFHVVAVRENRGRIGDHEISLGHTEPSRKVLTSRDWTTAWNIVIKATGFLFPHRRNELDAYGEYIQGEFTARQADSHWKVIRFDQSIRNEVGGATRILLTDFPLFERHRAAILLADGLFANPDTKQPARRPKSNEICIRFNSEGGCTNSSFHCRYRHACRKCGKGGHGASACEGKK